jgi:hypothetical protein
VENWCAVVVDAVNDRLDLMRWLVSGDEAAQMRLNELFMSTELNLDSDEAHLGMLVTGEAFVIVWREEEGIGDQVLDSGASGVQAFYNDPRLCHVQYDEENPRVKRFAAKWWVADDGTYRMTLYYPERLEYYETTTQAKNVSKASAFRPSDPAEAENPFGMIPVFHLRRERRKIVSELQSAISPQDAINKLFSDMMVAAEFGAFRQRWIISNADPGQLKNAPNEIWDLPAGDGMGQGTAVGEFNQTDLKVFLDAMDKLALSLAVITRTPKHYLFGHAGGDISGEALIALEAPLNAKCAKYIERLRATWRQVGQFMLELDGMTVAEGQVQPVFARPETVQPRTQAEIRQLAVAAGIPLATELRRDEGWSEGELEMMAADREAEEAAAVGSLARGLVEQQRRFGQEADGENERMGDE